MYKTILQMGFSATGNLSGRPAKWKKWQMVLWVVLGIASGVGNHALFGQTSTATLTQLPHLFGEKLGSACASALFSEWGPRNRLNSD